MRQINAAIAWFRRRPVWVADGLLALCVWYAEFTTVGVLASTDLLGPIRVSPTTTALVVLAGTLPLTFRRIAPKTTLVVTGGVSLVEAFLLVPTTGLGLLIALYTVAAWRPRREALGMLGVMLVGMVIGVVLIGSPEYGVSNAIVFTVAIALGDRTRVARARAVALQERARELEQERGERERLAVAGERARIARELHDIAAHGIAIIAVQAAGARRVVHTDPDRAAEALGEIEDTARNSLAEIRQAVALLRDDAPDVAPQPGLDDVDALIARFRDAGLRVTAVLPDPGSEVGPTVGLTVYRIVQEGLTNTLRHAGNTRAHVRVAVRPHQVRVVVGDEGPTSGAGVPDGDAAAAQGYGLLGLRERVRSHGGRLTVRPRSDGYVLDAEIPLGVHDPPHALRPAVAAETATPLVTDGGPST